MEFIKLNLNQANYLLQQAENYQYFPAFNLPGLRFDGNIQPPKIITLQYPIDDPAIFGDGTIVDSLKIEEWKLDYNGSFTNKLREYIKFIIDSRSEYIIVSRETSDDPSINYLFYVVDGKLNMLKMYNFFSTPTENQIVTYIGKDVNILLAAHIRHKILNNFTEFHIPYKIPNNTILIEDVDSIMYYALEYYFPEIPSFKKIMGYDLTDPNILLTKYSSQSVFDFIKSHLDLYPNFRKL